MKKQGFSLVELLVVIGIISLLAGLMIPAVMSSKAKGMVTQAKADMNAIRMALVGVERDYKTFFKASGGKYTFYKFKDKDDVKKAEVKVFDKSHGLPDGKTQLVLGGVDDKFSGQSVSGSDMVDGYYGMITELSVPKEIHAKDADKININKRLIKYLDPRPDFAKGEDTTLWQDPWGNPYVVMVDSDYDGKIYIPFQDSKLVSTSTTAIPNQESSCLALSGKVFLYSLGPNGEDDGSFNADNGGKTTTDDIRSWE